MTPVSKQKQHDFSFYFLKWLIISLIALLLFCLITKPLRKQWAKNYVGQGDIYLEQKKYQSAILEYDKALFLYWKDSDAKARITLAGKASLDVMELENFYKEKKIDPQIELIRKVKALPENETSAVKTAKEMIENGEYQYAIILAKDATEMDRNYRDGWLYLGIANLDTAKMLELNKNSRQQYIDEAEKALQKAKNLDPENKITQDYLSELQKIK